jgi:hypothetical protein
MAFVILDRDGKPLADLEGNLILLASRAEAKAWLKPEWVGAIAPNLMAPSADEHNRARGTRAPLESQGGSASHPHGRDKSVNRPFLVA